MSAAAHMVFPQVETTVDNTGSKICMLLGSEKSGSCCKPNLVWPASALSATELCQSYVLWLAADTELELGSWDCVMTPELQALDSSLTP